jgi:hypothetical protein
MKGLRQTAAVRERKAVFPVQISAYNSRHAARRISSILQTRRQYGRRLFDGFPVEQKQEIVDQKKEGRRKKERKKEKLPSP